MNALADLATTALLGTGRRPPDWPSHEGALGNLLAGIPREPVEKAVLQVAGVLGTCHLAGWQPGVAAAGVAPATAEDESKLAPPPALLPVLAGIFADGPARLQAEALLMLGRVGCLVPHPLLPRALDCGRRSTALRAPLLPVLGRRGAWLAAQNEAWQFAVGGSMSEDAPDEEVWQHGSPDQRRLWLTTLRQRDPAKARKLVTTAMAHEGARERTAFIEALVTGLSLEDQDFLESALSDKSKEARKAASQLLLQLPESRFMQGMIARLKPCLSMEKKFLRGTALTIEPPARFDPAWKDHLEEARPKGMTMGDRAWWLSQIVAGVPLGWWEDHTSLKPAELLAWAQKSEWKDAILQGWSTAQTLQRSVAWAEAFLSTELPGGAGLNALDLLETLPLPLREKHFLKRFSAAEAGQAFLSSAMLDRFLASIPFDAPPLSLETARPLLQLLKRRVNTGEARHDWPLRASLVEFACVIPPSLFEECAHGWDITKEEVQPFAEAVARLGIVLDQRKELQTLKS